MTIAGPHEFKGRYYTSTPKIADTCVACGRNFEDPIHHTRVDQGAEQQQPTMQQHNKAQRIFEHTLRAYDTATSIAPTGRLPRDAMFMEIAHIVAKRGTCPRAQVGAVIVRDGRIISIGYNGSLPGQPHCLDAGCDFAGDPGGGCVRTMHAESNAVVWGARTGVSTDAATMYATHSTCAHCAAIVVTAGITRFVYDREYRISVGKYLLETNNVEVVKYGSHS